MNYVRRQDKPFRTWASLVAAMVALTLAVAAVPALAQTPTTLYSFPLGAAPRNPNSEAIAQGRDGNLYTTSIGGGGGGDHCNITYCGTVFSITPSGTVTVVYAFGNDGYEPYGGETLGTDGNFYGTTYDGGTNSIGEVYKLTPAGVLTALHSFAGTGDGSHPYAAPIEGTNGIFYGTTTSAGVPNSTAYSVTSSGVFTTLHTFTGTDGQNIYAPLVQGTDGNFYGGTAAGGTNNLGVIFKMTPSGTVTVLHNFAGTDGSQAYYGLIQARDGNFYGTTYYGGTAGAGVIFKITPGGTYTVLYNLNGTTDESGPVYSLLQATDGKLYGITSDINLDFYGTIFSVTTSGTFTTLYSFTGGADGGDPLSPLRQHTNGLLYGDTNVGGDPSTGCLSVVYIEGQPVEVGGCGVFYSLNIGAKPFISLVSTSGKVGSKVGILGQGFSKTSVVKFGGVQATTFKLTGSTFISATVPAGAIDGKVTVTTGSTQLTSPQTFIVHDSWSNGTAMPTAVEWSAAGVIGTKIYVVGGYTKTTVVANNAIYDPVKGLWSTGAPIPSATAQAASAVVNNILYIFGGSTNGGGAVTDEVWAYDPTKNTWSAKSSMPTARCSVVAVVENGIIYVIGGYNNGSRLNTVESYNPATDTWTSEAPLINGKTEISAGLIGSTIVAADGYTGSGDNGDNEAYNATTNSWSSLTPDPTPRNGSCSGVIGGLLYGSDGNTNNAGAISLNESFNLKKDAWTTLSVMSQPATDPGSAVYKGQLFCFGGSSYGIAFQGTIYNNVQIYQP
jgi:uncharacterized repeat protein (TIGR03803 family)